MADSPGAPESIQARLGDTRRPGTTGRFPEIEEINVGGGNEIVIRDTNFGGNASPACLNPADNQIDLYTSDGHWEHQALVVNPTFGQCRATLLPREIQLGVRYRFWLRKGSEDDSRDATLGWPGIDGFGSVLPPRGPGRFPPAAFGGKLPCLGAPHLWETGASFNIPHPRGPRRVDLR